MSLSNYLYILVEYFESLSQNCAKVKPEMVTVGGRKSKTDFDE